MTFSIKLDISHVKHNCLVYLVFSFLTWTYFIYSTSDIAASRLLQPLWSGPEVALISGVHCTWFGFNVIGLSFFQLLFFSLFALFDGLLLSNALPLVELQRRLRELLPANAALLRRRLHRRRRRRRFRIRFGVRLQNPHIF